MRPTLPLISLLLTLLISACIHSGASESASRSHGCAPKHYPGLEHVIIDATVPQQIKEYEGFTVNFNAFNRTPNYSAWELLGTETGDYPRSDNFWQDADIKNCPSSADYKRSGYDRGHLFPAAEAKWSSTAMNQCFSMANICPQKHALNSGAWKTLEETERRWAARDSALVIVAGPIYLKSDTQRIGDAGVRVPSGFFKAIIAPYLPEPRGIAFVYPNDRAPGDMRRYAMSIDHLEKLLGYDLFHNLPDTIEQEIESKANYLLWTRSK